MTASCHSIFANELRELLSPPLTRAERRFLRTRHGSSGIILLRVAAGYDTDQIANDIGMSRPMVDHYMRFKDQMEVATAGRERLRLVNSEGGPRTPG